MTSYCGYKIYRPVKWLYKLDEGIDLPSHRGKDCYIAFIKHRKGGQLLMSRRLISDKFRASE